MLKFNFLKNGSNDFDQILWINSTIETQHCDTSEFSRKKSLKLEKIFFKFFQLPNAGPKPIDQYRSNSHFFDLILTLKVVYIRKN